MEETLVAPLESGLSDVVGATVIPELAVGLELVEVLLIEAADMSHDVRKEFALRVLTEQARLQVHARKAIAVRGKPRDLVVRKTRADRQAFEVLAFVEQFLETPPVLGSDFDEGRKLVDQRLKILHFTRRDLERVGNCARGRRHCGQR